MISFTPELEDEFLERILPCQTDMLYQRTLVAFARDHDRDSRIGLHEGDQFLRRRTLRRTDYLGPANDKSRTSRSGRPFSWVESRILGWAKQTDNSESKTEVTVEYLANLLQRTKDEVVKEIARRESQRDGIPSLF